MLREILGAVDAAERSTAMMKRNLAALQRFLLHQSRRQGDVATRREKKGTERERLTQDMHTKNTIVVRRFAKQEYL